MIRRVWGERVEEMGKESEPGERGMWTKPKEGLEASCCTLTGDRRLKVVRRDDKRSWRERGGSGAARRGPVEVVVVRRKVWLGGKRWWTAMSWL
jgi:hypothetical protein